MTVLTGKLHVKSYRIEQVKLDEPLETSRGTPIQKSYRVIVTDDDYAGPYTIWIDDEPHSAWTYDPNTILVTFYGRPKLQDGATVSVTRGNNICNADYGSESVLKDRLSLPPELRALPQGLNRLRLRTIHSVLNLEGCLALKFTFGRMSRSTTAGTNSQFSRSDDKNLWPGGRARLHRRRYRTTRRR